MKRSLEDDVEVVTDLPQKRTKENQSTSSTSTAFLDSRIKLTRVIPAEDPLQNVNCTSLEELLNGDIDTCYQFNYMLDLAFFMANVPSENLFAKFHFVVHKDDVLIQQAKATGLNTIKFTFPYLQAYGTHHSKMMIIFYKDDTARVVIHTANLVEKDWGKKSQGCWISPLLPKKPQTKSLASPYVTSEFEHDFFLYLKAYGKDLEVLCERLQYFDFSGIRASLVASVPGSHKAKDHKMKLWGHARMADLLGNVPLSEGCKKESTVVFQFSSIGALGNDDKWLANEFGSSLSMCAANGVKSRPPIKIVFPTVEDVRDSNQGWRAGNSIPFSNENWVKQKSYMKPLLHKWIANDSLRKYAMPHIKTFARLNEKTGDISWLYVGSHNLSKAAWGKYELKNTQLHIRSYEIGVLLHPAIFKRSIPESQVTNSKNTIFTMQNYTPTVFSALTVNDDIKENADGKLPSEVVIPIRLPYDLPLTRYSDADEPWRWNISFPGYDSLGELRE